MAHRKTLPEKELIDLFVARDIRGLEYLYDHYGAGLYGVILRIVGNQTQAEELLQESFLRIWERVQHYDPAKGRLFTWMLNIARNLAIDTVRSREFRNQAPHLPSDMVMQTAAMKGLETETNGRRHITESLERDYREIIDLLYFDGHTQAEVASELKIPLGTVKSRSRAALLKLRSLFENEKAL